MIFYPYEDQRKFEFTLSDIKRFVSCGVCVVVCAVWCAVGPGS